MDKVVMQSDRLILELLSLDAHLVGFHNLMSDEKSMKWLKKAPSESLEDSKAKLLARLASPDKPWMEQYAVLLKPSSSNETGALIGILCIPRVSSDGEIPELGYGIHSDYWGHGYASEAIALFISFYWAEESITPCCSCPNYPRKDSKDSLEAYTGLNNLASERVLIKAGFRRKEGLKGVHEIVDVNSGEKVMEDVTCWTLERPRK
ncbi:hypothetical protein LOCC1_G001993 [Lachnellula occidentalis]|uniref:N-acetyltransferase domain-containing protein n=1 Tax=Lachnellula occidentalis TaxID=215460 RepID=A0A8H8S6W3_9HELO|nr:hypothetical protein LOCC1_G001993 [Lachnellula occidentalis]